MNNLYSANNPALTLTTTVRFGREHKGRLRLQTGELPPRPVSPPPGRVQRLSRLMALAIRFDGLLQRGEVKDYAQLARLGHVTRARLTQIMNLLHLAPDLQEALLFLPRTTSGRDAIKEWQVRPIAGEPLWTKQRSAWKKLCVATRYSAEHVETRSI